MKTYEGMFLFDPAITTDWDSIQKELDRLMERAGARLIASGKWDERRLAYEIRGRKRGVYALAYFEADPTKVASIERDVQLSEAILRCLVVRADHVSAEQIKELTSGRAAGASPVGYGEDEGRHRPRDREAGKADDLRPVQAIEVDNRED